ncbi:hypothetical protein SprV_0401575700 [Sparganum proliferum]
MDAVERKGKVKKTDGRRLLVAVAGYKNSPQCEYLVYTFTSITESGLIGPRPRVTTSLESLEKDNSEDLRINGNEAHVAVVLASRLISFLEDEYKDAQAAVIRSNLVSPCLSNHLMEPEGRNEASAYPPPPASTFLLGTLLLLLLALPTI